MGPQGSHWFKVGKAADCTPLAVMQEDGIVILMADVLASNSLQIFLLVVYCRFSQRLFITDFLAGCLLQIFSPVIRLLLTHQSSVDAVACLFRHPSSGSTSELDSWSLYPG